MAEKRNAQGQTLEEFLAAYKPGDYEKPSVTVDMLLFGMDEAKDSLKILLIKRGNHPYIDDWAIPGGFMDMHESAYEAACRELEEETGLTDVYMEQLYTFTKPDRDPRMRVVDIAYMALLPVTTAIAGDDAKDAAWFDVSMTNDKLLVSNKEKNVQIEYTLQTGQFKNGKSLLLGVQPKANTDTGLAFDHAEILYEGIMRLRNKMLYTDIIFNLLPDTFSMSDLQVLYKLIMNEEVHPQKIRRMMSDYIEQTDELRESVGRPQILYRYKKGVCL